LTVSIVINLHREDAIQAAKLAASWLFDHKFSVQTEQTAAEALGLTGVSPTQIGESDLVIAFGGDGTIIRAAHLCSERGTPILGVHFGRFGFVTQCMPEDLMASLSAFVDKEHRIESRMMITATLIRKDQTVATIYALNEAVLQRTVTDRMLTFDVEVNGQLLTSYPADGVMVSTPTGSTGYNLSAGGPVLDPSLEALILVAIAPHTLSARPLVLGGGATVRLRLESGGDAVLSGDSQTRLHLVSGDEVEIKRAERVTRLVTLQNEDFLYKLSNRLFWSQSILGNERNR
jgi:NAD+ kinase